MRRIAGDRLRRPSPHRPTTRAREAAHRLAIWRDRARTLTPYAFYAGLLGEEGGRKALLSRLGPDAADPIDEFLALALDHERGEAPSLTLFLAEVEATDAAIKRDMEAESEGVRVLTVHASKGLEAPIVFLPDTCGAPDGRHDPKLLPLAPAKPGDPALFAWSRKAAEDCEAVAPARAEKREAEAGEHRRLLYVAMTRAAQRLIVAGFENSKGRAAGCWHDLVRSGLEESMSRVPAYWGNGDTILRFGEGPTAEDEGESGGAADGVELPGWLRARAAPEAAATPLRPSAAGVVRQGEAKRMLEGRLAHALLQMLPDVPRGLPGRRRRRLISTRMAALSPTRRGPRYWLRSPRSSKRRSSRISSAPARAARSLWPES